MITADTEDAWLHTTSEKATLQLVAVPNSSTPCLLFFLYLATLGCGPRKNTQPPATPTSPAETQNDHVKDSAKDSAKDTQASRDPTLAALASEPWGWRNDKQDIFHFPLTDWQNWRRVRYWGLPVFLGFRYGDSQRFLTALWVKRLRSEDPDDINVCFDRMYAWGQSIAEVYQASIVLGPRTYASWKSENDVIVQSVDAKISALFSRRTYRAAVGVTFGWPRVCIVYGYAFQDDGDDTTAAQVRDRYAREAFSLMTVKDPLRPPDGVEELPSIVRAGPTTGH